MGFVALCDTCFIVGIPVSPQWIGRLGIQCAFTIKIVGVLPEKGSDGLRFQFGTFSDHLF